MSKNTTEIKTRSYQGRTYYYPESNGKPLFPNRLGWLTAQTAKKHARDYEADLSAGLVRPGRFR